MRRGARELSTPITNEGMTVSEGSVVVEGSCDVMTMEVWKQVGGGAVPWRERAGGGGRVRRFSGEGGESQQLTVSHSPSLSFVVQT